MIKGKTAIIAGSGALPFAVAERLSSRGGEKPYLVLLRGQADKRLYVFDHCEISVVEFARLIAALKAKNIRNIILAGGVAQRPNLRDLHCDWPTLKALPKLFFALRRGDDALLRAFIKLMEGYGFRVIGAHEIVPELLAPKGLVLTKKTASKAEKANIDLAMKAARILGRLDIGQGAVTIGGRIVAVEGAEGTNAMLERVAALRMAGKIPPKGGVLVKMKKPNQEMRADLPTIGPETIEHAYKAGLAGLAVEAEGSFILNIKNVAEQADKYGLFIETL
ncbi:LpxI family protein [Candidatus Tokpelaia sp.]|uniref:LpxI family protein n=1 Tax=Candidatus Tokpelaia sp. TaxID=2233777 RepID=UPI00123B46AC|nr:UDP-2,3-diacylglucosamine diphosphatase LpxI [Candidatus Tokpelaia sp.]KAA6404903.1 DUF1009 domain-containing protein [Candidatus Tokpelaia sp.]